MAQEREPKEPKVKEVKTDYQGNTLHKRGLVPPEEKQIEKIVTGEVVQKKKPLGRKVKDIFIAADLRGVANYVMMNVLIPAARNMLVDAASRGSERLFLGENAARRGRSMDPRTHISYNQPVHRIPNDPRLNGPLRGHPTQQTSRTDWARYDYILSTREDADRVLEQMGEIAGMYNCVTIADLNQMMGIPVNPIDFKWGWDYIGNAHVSQIREGWLLVLPPVVEIS